MSKRRSKKGNHEDHIDESWLLPYADLLTLLVALFIVLFAMSSVDAQKFEKLSRSFNEVFSGGTGVLDFPSPMPDGNMEPIKKQSIPNDYMDKEKDQEELKELQMKVETYIDDKELTDKLETSLTTEGLLITIRENVLFHSGSADVRSKDLSIAQEISDLLVINPPRNIIISGHTDNVPIRNSQYESNWELSVMRAVNFMKVLLKNKELNPAWFSAKGFGEYQPTADNLTNEGKSKNRRVEILILPRSEVEKN
ncbi:flagellar motor protein MotB [Cytobacillus purgationiresistens]|uniref:Chemotaxis protein MotB n=1 Tax=Cytobacillus purgationiresistens TaxID=863449 RepID=A0ABU0AJV3_9BACI|nr:flagellar motor protein MotB [Cytobacillus purgationiresistens]MDQ0271544.1 chemotaxis protein MotB [Cytobacillus purgationiresistens]